MDCSALNSGLGPRIRALVIGGATGTGRSLANGLARQNAELILADHDGAALRRAAVETGAHGIFCDVMSEASIEVFRADILDRFGSINLLINAAGRGYARTLGTVRMSIAMLPLLRRANGQAHIVNVAAADDAIGRASRFSYASSIDAFYGACAGLADRVRGSSVEISTVVPDIFHGGISGRSLSWREYDGGLTTRFGNRQCDFDLLAYWLAQRIAPAKMRLPQRPPGHPAGGSNEHLPLGRPPAGYSSRILLSVAR